MTEFVAFPNIVWKITNVSSFCKKTSPCLNFYNSKWKLKLVYKQGSQGNVIQINLKRSGDGSAFKEFNIITQFVRHVGRTLFTQSMQLSISAVNEWLVWEQTEKYICNGLSYGRFKNFNSFCTECYFICTISPDKDWQPSDVPQGDGHAVVESPGYSPCITSMCQDFGKFYNNHMMSDVILVCGNLRICAHRAILGSRSPMFAAMFRSNMKESRNRIVNITELKPSILEQLIRYMYSGEIPDLTEDIVEELYAAADKYGVEALKMKCGVFMVQNTEPENVHQAEATAAGNSSGCPKDVLTHFSNIKALLSTKEWSKLAEENPKFAHDAFLYFMRKNP